MEFVELTLINVSKQSASDFFSSNSHFYTVFYPENQKKHLFKTLEKNGIPAQTLSDEIGIFY